MNFCVNSIEKPVENWMCAPHGADIRGLKKGNWGREAGKDAKWEIVGGVLCEPMRRAMCAERARTELIGTYLSSARYNLYTCCVEKMRKLAIRHILQTCAGLLGYTMWCLLEAGGGTVVRDRFQPRHSSVSTIVMVIIKAANGDLSCFGIRQIVFFTER